MFGSWVEQGQIKYTNIVKKIVWVVILCFTESIIVRSFIVMADINLAKSFRINEGEHDAFVCNYIFSRL